MKKWLFVPALFLLFISACHKKEQTTQAFSYTVNNIRDAAMQKGGSDTILPYFQFLSGLPENINLSVTGLPDGVTAQLSPTTGRPSFSLQVIFKASATAVAGVYPVSIVSSGSSAGTQREKIDLSIVDDCSPSLVDSFRVTESCQADNYTYKVAVKSTNTPYVVQMSNFGNFGFNTIIRVNLNCIKHTLFVPLQDVGGGFRVTGYGSFTDSSISINYALSSDLNIEQDVCNDVFNRL